MSDPIHVISLGAGVQSSTMALMAAAGELVPMPNFAIFADTTYEPAAVYTWLAWLEQQLPFPVYRATARRDGGLFAQGGKEKHCQIPTYGAKGFGKRQCTTNWKLRPMFRECRTLLGLARKRVPDNTVTFWIGISLDEVHRMKPSREPWVRNIWPLIEKRIKRADCLRWMEHKGFPRPPRSACVFCPFKSDAEWRETRKDPVQMQLVRQVEVNLPTGEFLHRKKQLIDQVDLSTNEDHGQMSLFGNECLGMCGV